MTSPIEVLSLAETVRRECGKAAPASEAKQLLKVARQMMDSILPVLSKMEACGEAA
eukprot:CAMPEP_0113598208 /NCGR_PEP_ID=MMETSP0015_2-20120614/41447_1 /TAXON_ID=2838 /ORGANISM="Odontella" /LENGTH=55 /DNA_ID=CAMNT_0000506175 /DNA_START=16 /DNA_END=180 /DNA_ORIENTATION=+ /assembly_acc=CAM_ASM_000160